MYSENVLVETAYEVLSVHDSSDRYVEKGVTSLYNDEDFKSSDMKPFFDKLREYDKNHGSIMRVKVQILDEQ